MEAVGRNASAVRNLNGVTSGVPGRYGTALQGFGTGGVGGMATAPGAADMSWATQLTALAIVEFTSFIAAPSNEACVLRCNETGNENNTSYAVDYFADSGGIRLRPLIATTGTTGWTAAADISLGFAPTIGVLYVLCLRWVSGSSYQVALSPVGGALTWYNSAVLPSGAVTATGGSSAAQSLYFLGSSHSDSFVPPMKMYGAAISKRALSTASVQQIVQNPWLLFEPQRTVVALGALASSGEISGAATAVATAGGGLTTAIQLSAAPAAVSTAAGMLTTAIALAGAAVAGAAASGALSTGIRLAASAQCSAASSAQLTTGIRLAGAAVATATASGALQESSAALQGSAAASASASGVLSTAIRLVGAASASSAASGVLSVGPAGAQLAGQASAVATAAAVLTTGIHLRGVASCSALAAGQLSDMGSVAVTPAWRTLIVPAQDRRLVVDFNPRRLVVPADSS